MSSRYRKKNRLGSYLYNGGMYFVTICVYAKKQDFGYIEEGEMKLNQYGNIVQRYREYIPSVYDNVFLDESIVMPNHIHGIIHIDNSVVGADSIRLRGRQYNTLSRIIKGYKQIASREIHKIGYHDFQWQKSFYDHIIRDEKDLVRIQEYIINNPYKWEDDKYYV